MFDIDTDQHEQIIDTIVAASVQPNNYQLLRHLAQVLGLHADHAVLMLASEAEAGQAVLQEEIGCNVEVFSGDPQQLPYETEQFDSVLVVRPISQPLHTVARELARVLKRNGTLGMFIFNIHPDQVFGKAAFEHAKPITAINRPAAAYRAVLAESGFTAFVSENRQRSVDQTTLQSYRQHLLQAGSDIPTEAKNIASQVLNLVSSGGVGVTIVTAEKVI
jgi:ubiquinone/menaquinone biosynthesis C-methylase UbiE